MKKPSLDRVIEDLIAAKRELWRLQFDEDDPQVLGKAGTQAGLAKLERKLGKPLPPSYRAFLALHDGWEEFEGDAKVLAMDDQDSDWVKKRIQQLGDLFTEFGDDDPFKRGCLPVVLGKKTHTFLVLDPAKVRPDGEMEFASYDLTRKEETFKTFLAYLQRHLEVTNECIESEKSGVDDDEED